MKRLLFLFGMVSCWISLVGQSTVTTFPPLVNNNGSSGITFEVQSSAPIIITDIKNLFNSGSISGEVWYRVGGVKHSTGAPSVTTANGWVQHWTGSVSGNGSTPVSIPNWTNLTIASGQRVGIAILGGLSYQTWTSSSQDTFTDNTLTIYTGQNIGYGGGGTWPNHPRQFLGSVTYIPSAPCTSPPTAGTAQADQTLVCVGGEVNLSLSGATFGLGMGYQWQSSLNGTTWTNMLNDTTSSIKAYPTDTTWYRAILTCGTGMDTSTQVVVNAIGTPMSGTYTVNSALASSGTNFNSFADLATALNCGGLAGPVTVNVVTGSGPYYEGVEFLQIAGASATNTVTINGNGEALIDSGATNPNYAALLLNGTDHMTIDSLRIMAWGSTNRMGLQFTNEADSNTIRNCVIEVDPNATSSSVVALAFSGSTTSSTTFGDNGDYNLIEGNTIRGGYYGLRLTGASTTSSIFGNQLINNRLEDFYVYGMYIYYVEGSEIRGNDINRLGRSVVTTGYSFYCGYVTNNTEISGNWIHDMFAQGTSSTSTFYGIYCFSSDASTGSEVKVYNNLFSDNSNGGTHYILYNSGSDGWWYYHNTVVEDSPTISGTGATRVFYQTGTASNIEFKNNLMYMDRGTTGANYMLYLATSSSGITMDYNAYYMPQAGTGTFNFGYYSGNVADFTAWKAVNSGAFDQNSAEGDPFFNDPATYDYTPGAAYFNDIGTNLSGIVATDITGALRSTTPDPGAYEFSPPPGPDMSVSNIYSGGASCGTSTSILVEVLNQGTDTVTSFTVNYTIDGVAQTGIPVTGVYATGAFDTIAISGIPISGASLTSVVVTLNNVAPGTDTDTGNNTDSIQLRTGLSGTYTVNSGAAASSTNFVSFSSLAQALNTYGVCGNVTVNVVSTVTPYYDQFYLNEIVGVSSSATVTINGNGNTLEYLASDGGARATVILNGTDWVTIDSLTINALGTTTTEYGFGVSLTNSADHNTIRNCNINVEDDLSSSNYAGITISGSLSSSTQQGKSGNYNTIEGNTVIGGYAGITCLGESTDSANGNVIRNNVVEDFYIYGSYCYYNDHLVVSGNDFSRPNRTTLSTFYGSLMYGATSSRFEGNKIHDGFAQDPTLTGTSYCMYVYYLDGTVSDPSVVANNLLYNLESDGTTYSVYAGNHNNTYMVNNTFILDDPTHTSTSSYTTRQMYLVGTFSGGSISNNILYFNRAAGGTAHMIYATGTIDNMDNNTFYAPNTAPAYTFGYYSGGAVNTFNSWQATTGLDEHSLFTPPFFTSIATDNYIPQSSMLDGGGEDFSSLVTVDIDGVTRGTPPDIGAYEFAGAPCTGLSQIGSANISATSGTVVWQPNPATVTIEWGPTGFKQASLTGTIINVPVGDTSSVISGLTPLSCYDYYLTMNCTSTIPGAPPAMGPYTFCTDCAIGPLSGTFTVGGTPGPTNFPTLDSVITTLNGCGINGPVVLNLMGGTHNAITLGQIDGSSAVNTITFNGSAGYGDSIVATSQTAAIDLDGCEHVTFNDLYVENAGGSFVVWLHNSAEYITIDNCELVGSRSTTTFSTGVVVASSSSTSTTSYGNNVNNLTVNECKIVGNYYGMTLNGSSTTSKISNLTITDNEFSDQYYYGMRLYYTDSVLISGNTMPGFRNTFSYGFYCWYNDMLEISGNAVYNTNYGIYSYYTGREATSAAQGSRFVNNMLSGGTYGIYMYGNKYLDIYHNSMTGGTYGMYLSGSTVQGTTSSDNVDIRNNIIINPGTNYAFYLGTEPFGTFTLDYNIYNSGGDIAFNGVAYTTLAAWQAADTTKNQNSLEGDPIFVGPNNFHVLGPLANDTGASVGVLVDIDGDARPASGSTKVDIGADEFSPASCFPTSNLTVASVTNTTATLQWDTIQGAPGYIIEYGPGRFKPGTGTMVSATGNTHTITGLPTTNNLAFQAYVAVDCGGGDTSNWVGPVNIIHSAPAVLCTDGFEVYRDTVIDGQSRLFVGWNGAVTDGAVSTTYAKTGTKSLHIFGTADIVTNMPSLTSGIHSLKWDYYMPTTFGGYYNILHNYTGPTNVWAIEVYIDANGTATVNQGTNGTGVIGTYTVTPGAWNNIEHIIDLDNDTAWINVNGTPTSVGWQFSLGSTNMGDRFNAVDFYAAANAGQTPNYYVDNFCLGPYTPPSCNAPTNVMASNTNIGCDSVEVSWTSNANNNSILEYGPAGFVPGTGAGTIVPFITSPYVITGLTPGTNYQFYIADTCATDTSQVVGPIAFSTPPAPVAHASFTFTSSFVGNTQVFTFNGSGSTNADTYSWDFGNGSTGSGATPPNVTYNLPNKTVNVKLTVTNACGSTHDTTITITTTIGLEEPEFGKTLVIYPNPSQDKFNLSFNKLSGGELSFEILDASGRRVYFEDLGSFGGTYSGTMDLGNYAKGVYILRINSDLGVVTRRLNRM